MDGTSVGERLPSNWHGLAERWRNKEARNGIGKKSIKRYGSIKKKRNDSRCN